MTVPETADAVFDLLEQNDLTINEVLHVVSFVLLNIMDGAVQEGIPPLVALDEDLTTIRHLVTAYFAQPQMPAHTHH